MKSIAAALETHMGHPRGSILTPSRVLMISHAFPPTGGPGVQRSAKFAKYLPQFGWKPIVWSAAPLRQLPADGSLLDDLPSDLIHHQTRPMSHASVHEGMARWLRRLPLTERVKTAMDWRLERLLKSLSTWMCPDEYIAWAMMSVWPLLRLVRRERIDVIYSTYSPLSNHLLGAWLKRLTGLPWVSDYRDLWVDDCYYEPPGRLRAGLERRMQRRLLRQADAVIGVTEGCAEVLKRYVPGDHDKFYTIHNGVDLADFASLDRADAWARLHGPDDRFVITYTGLLSAFRADDAVVEALSRFTRWTDRLTKRFEFRVVGSISKTLQEKFKNAGVPLVATGYLPHREAIEHMVASDVLLLITPSGSNSLTYMTAKTYEYLAAGRPILAVGPSGSVAQQLVRDCGVGVGTKPEVEDLLGALKRMFVAWQQDHLPQPCALDRLQPYTREFLTGKLATVLHAVVSPRESGSRGKAASLLNGARHGTPSHAAGILSASQQ